MNVKEKILETLKNSDKPMKGAQIAESTGIEKSEIDKAMKALKAEGKIISPKVCFYTIA